MEGVAGHHHLAVTAGGGGGHQLPQGGVVGAGEGGEVLRVSPGELVEDDYLPEGWIVIPGLDHDVHHAAGRLLH